MGSDTWPIYGGVIGFYTGGAGGGTAFGTYGGGRELFSSVFFGTNGGGESFRAIDDAFYNTGYYFSCLIAYYRQLFPD